MDTIEIIWVLCMCWCLCVCMRETERQRGWERERGDIKGEVIERGSIEHCSMPLCPQILNQIN